MSTTGQPIIRGIQAVGGVDIYYQYNSADNKLKVPKAFRTGTTLNAIDTSDGGVSLAGFRLDGEFLRAAQQIASSVVVPILGGGGVALVNNNRTGTLNINATRVSTPDLSATGGGKMLKGTGFGPVDANVRVYDLTFIAQLQQGQDGGDSVGATIAVCFDFCGKTTVIQFDGCTIASVDPVGLSGNDVVNYNVAINYLSWTCYYDVTTPGIQAEAETETE